MTFQLSPVRDRAPLLLTHTQWIEKEALAHMVSVARANFAVLDDEQKKHYVALHRQAVAAFEAVEDENARLKDTFKSVHLALLRRELKTLTGVDIDPERTRLYTRYREFKEGRSPLDFITGAVADETDARITPRAVDESRYVDHLRSVTLWDAACANFGYRTDSVLGQPYSYEDASYIDYGRPLGERPVKPFVELVRKLDFGSALSATLTQALGPDGQLKRLIDQASTLSFEFELLEAYRTAAISGVTQAGHAQLLEAFNSSKGYTVWPMSLCRPSGKQLLFDIMQALNPLISQRLHFSGITLPLYFIQLEGDSSVYSYFAQRLGGALRRHPSRAAAEQDFKQQLVHDHSRHQLGWFARQWSLQEMGYLHMLLSEEPRPKGLNWLAGTLYDGFHQAFPKHSLENLELHAEPEAGSHQPLAALLGARQAARYRSNLQMLATTKSEMDWQAFKDAVLAIGNEVLGMLTTPVPGGVLGLTKVMQTAIFGSLAYSVVQGVTEAYKGESSITFANALADTADLLISARLMGVAAKVHRQRMSTLWRQAGQPRKVIHPNGKVELRSLEHFAHPEQLALNDRQGLSDVELLQRMLPMDTPASAFNNLERMLKITATSREQLQAVWQGHSIPAPLAEGARRLQVERLIDRIISDVPLRGEMPANADSAVLALLTQLEQWPADTVLDVFNQQGLLIETYGKEAGGRNHIEVKRLDHGAYTARGDVTQGSARVEELFGLIVEQLPEASSLGREDQPDRSQTGRIASIRGQIADLAKSDRLLLFKALAELEGRRRSDPVASADPARKYLPLLCPSIADSTTLLLAKLHLLNPTLSIEGLESLIEKHPFSPDEVIRVFDDNAQPEVFARETKRLSIRLRVDRVLDGIYHTRAYHADSDSWARECAKGVLRESLGRYLVVTRMLSSAAEHPPVVDEASVELRYYGNGRYEAYDVSRGETLSVPQTGDSFYRAIGSVLRPHELSALGMRSATDVSGLRQTLGDAMLARRQPNGEVNLWDRTTAQYERDIVLLHDEPAGELGLYEVAGKKYLSLYGEVYGVEFDPELSKWRMVHPDKVGANTPLLEHNGHGAWRQSTDNPLQWSGLKLLRRLRAEPVSFSDEVGHQIMAVSGTNEAVLRQVHANNLVPPPLLIDTWKRFRIEQGIQRFVKQMQALHTLPEASSELQLLLLPTLPGWPADKVLQVVDAQGQTLQEYGPDKSSDVPRVTVTSDEMRNGGLLRAVLSRMAEDDVAALLGQQHPTIDARMLAFGNQIAAQARTLEPYVFKSLYNRSELSHDPHLMLVQKTHPELPKSVIENLLRHTTEQELVNFLDQGLIPPRLDEQIPWTAQKVRLCRAYEGLYLGATATADSERLTLRMLHALTGWPAGVRIEIHHNEPGGQVLDSIGPHEGARLKTLVKRGGQYRAYSSAGLALNDESTSGNNLLSSILHALDDTERSAIGVERVSDTQVLAAKISEQAIKHRANADVLLGLQPPATGRKPPMKVDISFMAYPLLIEYGNSTHSRELVTQANGLYPSFNLLQVFAFLDAAGATPDARQVKLAQLRVEYTTLQDQLTSWELNRMYPAGSRHIGVVLPGARRRVGEWLKRAWRKETEVIHSHDGRVIGPGLNLYGIHAGDLPALTADFSHIRLLQLDNMGIYNVPNEFLNCFPQLRVLSLSGNRLRSLPAAIGSMRQLTSLNLALNRIVLSAESVRQLAGLSALERLYLTDNPLGITPDLSQMTAMRDLELSHTGIDTWPTGVLALTHIERMNLRDNRITHIPQAVFEVPDPGAINRVTRIHGNPLSDESRHRLISYWARSGINLGYTPIVAHGHAQGLPEYLPGDITPWLLPDFSTVERPQRLLQWTLLQGFGSDADSFFKLLAGLAEAQADMSLHSGRRLQERVWGLIDSLLADTVLRDVLFQGIFYDVTCRDGAMVLFDNLEVQVLIHRAEHLAGEGEREAEHFKLAKGLFRLRQVDQIADAVVTQRLAAGANPDVAEIQLFYRVKLAEALDLPIQTRMMFHAPVAGITPEQLNEAKSSILAMDGSPAFKHSIMHEKLWRNFLLHKHPDRFTAIEAEFQRDYQKLSEEPDVSEAQELRRGEELVAVRDQKINHLVEELTEQVL